MRFYRDISGLHFGFLIALRPTVKRDGTNIIWLCKCVCGRTKEVSLRSLQNKQIISCGCKRIERYIGMLKPYAAFSRLFSSYKSQANRRSLCFLLSSKEFFNLTQQNCIYCGKSPSSVIYPASRKDISFIYNSVDRKDYKQGYITSNVVSSCKICNMMKGKLGFVEFIEQCRKVAHFNG